MDEWFLRRKKQFAWAAWCAIIAAVVGFGVQFYIKATDHEVGNRETYRTHWTRSYYAVHEMRDGVNIYQRPHDFPQLPIVAICMIPLTWLPHAVATVLFHLLKVVAAAVAVCCAGRIVTTTPASPPLAVRPRLWPGTPKDYLLLLAFLMTARWLSSDFQHGNVNTFYLMWVLLGLNQFVRGRMIWAGVVMGLSVVFKVTSGLFLIYFLWKRQWKCAIATIASVLLFAVVIPALVMGPSLAYKSTMNWREIMVEPYQQGFVWMEPHNQSLPGVSYHILEAAGASFEPIKPNSWLKRPAPVWRVALRVVTIIILLVMAYCCRNAVPSAPALAISLELSLVCMGMLMFSERSWKAHYIAMLLPNLTLLTGLAFYTWRHLSRTTTLSVLVIAYCVALFSGETIMGEKVSDQLEQFGQIFWHLVVVFVICCIMLSEMRSAASERSEEVGTS